MTFCEMHKQSGGCTECPNRWVCKKSGLITLKMSDQELTEAIEQCKRGETPEGALSIAEYEHELSLRNAIANTEEKANHDAAERKIMEAHKNLNGGESLSESTLNFALLMLDIAKLEYERGYYAGKCAGLGFKGEAPK